MTPLADVHAIMHGEMGKVRSEEGVYGLLLSSASAIPSSAKLKGKTY